MKLLYNSKTIQIKKINLVYSKEYKNINLISETISKKIANNFLSNNNIVISSDLINLKTLYSTIDFKKEIKIGSESDFYKDLLEYIIYYFDKNEIIKDINKIKEIIEKWLNERKVENIKVDFKTEDFDKILKTFFELILEDKKLDNETLRYLYAKYLVNNFLSDKSDQLKIFIIEDIDKFENKHLTEIIDICQKNNIITLLIFNSNKNFKKIFAGDLIYFDDDNLKEWSISEEFITKFITTEKWNENNNIDKSIFAYDLTEVMEKSDFIKEKERISKKISEFILNIIDDTINEEIYNTEIKEIIKIISTEIK